MHSDPPFDTTSDSCARSPSSDPHFLVRLMPFPPTASARFLSLQKFVDVIDRSISPDARVEAFLGAVKLLRARFGDLQTSSVREAEACLAHRLNKQFTSFVALEHLADLVLTAHDLQLVVGPDGPSSVPILVREDKRPVVNGPAEADRHWMAAEARLSLMSKQELKALGNVEHEAAIRLLRMRATFGLIGLERERQESRLAWLQTTGAVLWQKVLNGANAKVRMSYGPEVRLAVMGHLMGSAELAGAESWPVDFGPEPQSTSEVRPVHLVVAEPFPLANTAEERVLLKRYEALRRPIPLAQLPPEVELATMQDELLGEFPWAVAAVLAVFQELRARRRFGSATVGFTPLLLVGPAGCGKSRLARRLGETLGVRSLQLSVGGTSDSRSLLGTARGWSSAQPSVLVGTYLHGSASTLVILDEIDKPADSAHNTPPMSSALLGLLDPAEARRWFDECLQVHCDLSSLLYVGTANDATWIPGALLSRFRVVNIRRPTPTELRAAIPFAIRDVEREWRLPEGTFDGLGIDRLVRGRLESGRQLREAVRFAVAEWLARSGPSNSH